MFLKIAAVLVVLWLLGLIASFGGMLIHLLLLVALVMVVLHIVRGRSKTKI
ncbi:MAG: lmo0937 family membrane protein [Actinomycetota bacterium]|nr:lmo0937 family membrane protein [Actinomycetota bacterium]